MRWMMPQSAREPVDAVRHGVGGQRALPQAEFFGVRRPRCVGRKRVIALHTAAVRVVRFGAVGQFDARLGQAHLAKSIGAQRARLQIQRKEGSLWAGFVAWLDGDQPAAQPVGQRERREFT
jgi:hypothetical protein